MIVGTAGHIDHGKTTLVKALTGVDADRLPEEKARGITLDLGYAYAPLADGSVLGFVDVPGHEKLIHNMLAGATGIDFVLLVIAADDGPMPQTREHLELLGLLGLDRGAVALTKCDAVMRRALPAARAARSRRCWPARRSPAARCSRCRRRPAKASPRCAPISKRRGGAHPARRRRPLPPRHRPLLHALRHRHGGHRHGLLGKSRRRRHGDHLPGRVRRRLQGARQKPARAGPSRHKTARPATAARWR
jgi:hypothetical protein